MVEIGPLPEDLKLTDEDWQKTPLNIRRLVIYLLEEIARLTKRIDELEAKLNQRSDTSHRPSSTDSPFTKGKRKKKRKAGARRGHQGCRQAMLAPTERVDLKPERCSCGNTEFPEIEPYHIHQRIELPEIRMEVIHYVLYQGRCPRCGNLAKAHLTPDGTSGYGPRLTAFIGEVAGIQGNSRTTVKEVCSSVLGIPISRGGIQKVIDRVAEAIRPHYEAIGQLARRARVNYIDETSWFLNGTLMWLWAMVNTTVAYFKVHPKRSKEAFAALIEDWVGILVSDGYAVYQRWVELRQTCLAHLIREARGLSERKNPEIAAFGRRALAELKRLCSMAHAPPTVGEWRAFYARLSCLISQHHEREDEAGKFARRLLSEMDSLWVFLEVEGVEPTNNRAERALRFGVLWRKRSQGTASDKGNHWVERILSLKQTCRLRSMPTFPVLVEAVESYFKGHAPNLAWIEQH